MSNDPTTSDCFFVCFLGRKTRQKAIARTIWRTVLGGNDGVLLLRVFIEVSRNKSMRREGGDVEGVDCTCLSISL